MLCCSCFFTNALSNPQDYLREEKREVNHHGRVRTIGDEGEDIEENSEESFQINLAISESSFLGGCQYRRSKTSVTQ